MNFPGFQDKDSGIFFSTPEAYLNGTPRQVSGKLVKHWTRFVDSKTNETTHEDKVQQAARLNLIDELPDELKALPVIQEQLVTEEPVVAEILPPVPVQEAKPKKALPPQKHNPHIHLAVQEVIRFVAPTFGQRAGSLEQGINDFWSFFSSNAWLRLLSGGFLTRTEMASRPERLAQIPDDVFKLSDAVNFSRLSFLELLDNGFSIGLLEAFIQSAKPIIRRELKKGEAHLYSRFGGKEIKEVGAEERLAKAEEKAKTARDLANAAQKAFDEGQKEVRATVEKEATEIPLTQEQTQKVEEKTDQAKGHLEALIRTAEQLEAEVKRLKEADTVLPASLTKRIMDTVISVFSFLISLPFKALQVVGLSKKVVEQVDTPKTDEQKKTDKAMWEFIHKPIKNFLKMLPRFMEWGLSPIGERVGDKLIDMIAIRIRIFRDYLIGEQNQERVSRLFDGIVDNMCHALGKRLQTINNYYFTDRYDGTLVEKIADKVSTKRPDNEIFSLRESKLIHEVSQKFAHPAIPVLNYEESEIYAKNEIVEKAFEEVLKEQIACQEKIDQLKCLIVNHPTQAAVYKQAITNLEKEALALNTKNEKATSDFKTLRNIEYRMEQAEKAYLRNLSETILDTILFPKGIPFYWNVTVLMPDFAQLGFNVFSFLTNSNSVEKVSDRAKLIQSVITKEKKIEFKEIKSFRDSFPLIGAIFNRNTSFKCQGAREYLLEMMATALSVGLKFGLNFGVPLAEKRIDYLANKGEKLLNLGPLFHTFSKILKYLTIDPTDKARMIKERLGMERINKYLVFSILDAAIEVCKKEATNTLTEGILKPEPLVPAFDEKVEVMNVLPTVSDVTSFSGMILTSASNVAIKSYQSLPTLKEAWKSLREMSFSV